MSIVQLPDNKFVAGSIFEITAFPKAEIIDQDSKKTLKPTEGYFANYVLNYIKSAISTQLSLKYCGLPKSRKPDV